MYSSKKIFAHLILRGIGAVAVGFAIVTAVALGLTIAGGNGNDGAPAIAASSIMKFPQNEQMLKDLSREILNNKKDLATSAPAPSDIEPAAGTADTGK